MVRTSLFQILRHQFLSIHFLAVFPITYTQAGQDFLGDASLWIGLEIPCVVWLFLTLAEGDCRLQ